MKYALHIRDAFLVDFGHNYKVNSSKCYQLYSKKEFECCCNASFVQDELFVTQKNVIDGMTLLPPEMGLFVRCLFGYCLFVFIDLRKESGTFMAKMEVPLNTPSTGVFIPPGCAFGFCVIEGPS